MWVKNQIIKPITGAGAQGSTGGGAHSSTGGGAHGSTGGGAHSSTGGGLAHSSTGGGAHSSTGGGAAHGSTGGGAHSSTGGGAQGSGSGAAHGSAALMMEPLAFDRYKLPKIQKIKHLKLNWHILLAKQIKRRTSIKSITCSKLNYMNTAVQKYNQKSDD